MKIETIRPNWSDTMVAEGPLPHSAMGAASGIPASPDAFVAPGMTRGLFCVQQ